MLTTLSFKVLLISLCLLPLSNSFAESEPSCLNTAWKLAPYTDTSGTYVAVIEVSEVSEVNATALSCLVVTQLLALAHNVPKNLTAGLIESTTGTSLLAKWNLKEDFFLLIETHLEGEESGAGRFTLYPNVLDRLKDITLVTPFPTRFSNPLENLRFKSGPVKASKQQLLELLEGGKWIDVEDSL